uniref:Uncharacterized protein n=1 Tax=Aotus nancymaae TaxID=37293 RepID=A0A2K5D7Y3_AOTNA
VFSKTSFPLETASPLPPFTSGSRLAFFASSFPGLPSSGFQQAPSVGFLLAIIETEETPPLGVKPEVELSTRVAFRASSATFPLCRAHNSSYVFT